MTEERKAPFLNYSIDQVAIVVKDLDQAVEQYWESFGIGPWTMFTFGSPLLKKMIYKGQPTEFKYRIALSQTQSPSIELIEVLEGETVYGDFVKEHGYGVHHFGMFVEDLDEALKGARQAGLTVTQEGAGFGRDGDGRYAYLDTEASIGVTLEFIELPKGRPTPDGVYPPVDVEEMADHSETER